MCTHKHSSTLSNYCILKMQICLTSSEVCSYRAGHSLEPLSSCRCQEETTSLERLGRTGSLSHQTSSPLEYRSGCFLQKSKSRWSKLERVPSASPSCWFSKWTIMSWETAMWIKRCKWWYTVAVLKTVFPSVGRAASVIVSSHLQPIKGTFDLQVKWFLIFHVVFLRHLFILALVSKCQIYST